MEWSGHTEILLVVLGTLDTFLIGWVRSCNSFDEITYIWVRSKPEHQVCLTADYSRRISRKTIRDRDAALQSYAIVSQFSQDNFSEFPFIIA